MLGELRAGFPSFAHAASPCLAIQAETSVTGKYSRPLITLGAGKPHFLSCRQRQSVTALMPSLARSFGAGINSYASQFGTCGGCEPGRMRSSAGVRSPLDASVSSLGGDFRCRIVRL